MKRYDIATGKKTDLVKTKELIDAAQISSDGQWVVYVTGDLHGQRDGALHLIRIDGKELQTLACPGSLFAAALAWSPDQKHLAFGGGRDLFLLDMITGKIQQVWKTSSAIQGYGYKPVRWSGNTDLDVTRFIDSKHAVSAGDGLGGALGHNELYLIRNVTGITDPQNTPSEQHTIPTIAGASGDECQNFDLSPDTARLLFSDCQARFTPNPPQSDIISYRGPGTIDSQAIAGGPVNTIYQSSTHGIRYARYITNSTILFVDFNVLMDTNYQGGLWKINTDGSGLKQLVSTQSTKQAQDVILDMEKMNVPGYRPWFSISPDGTMFAIGIAHYSSHDTESLLFGSLNGGSTTTFATTAMIDNQGSYDVSLLGWVSL